MRHYITPLLLSSFLLVVPASAQVLYNNGVVKGGDGAFGLTTNPGEGFAGADASQANPAYGFGVTAVFFGDDFTLDSISNIASLTVYSYLTNSPSDVSPFVSTTINIWNGLPGGSGSIIATSSNQVSSVFTNVYRTRADVVNTSFASIRPIFATTVSFAGLTLDAGNYWFTFSQNNAGFINSPFVTSLVNGTPQAISGNAIAFDGANWIPIPYQPSSSPTLPTVTPELSFLVNGVSLAPEPGSLALVLLPMSGSLLLRHRRRKNSV